MNSRAMMRASDADRERVAERLRQAAVEGRLLAEELDDRLGVALSARTYGELDRLVADLPGSRVAPTRPPRRSLLTIPVLTLVLLVVAISAVGSLIGGHSHSGHGFGGAPLIWIIWIAIGWRFFAYRRSRSR